jgi:hypothetical protein
LYIELIFWLILFLVQDTLLVRIFHIKYQYLSPQNQLHTQTGIKWLNTITPVIVDIYPLMCYFQYLLLSCITYWFELPFDCLQALCQIIWIFLFHVRSTPAINEVRISESNKSILIWIWILSSQIVCCCVCCSIISRWIKSMAEKSKRSVICGLFYLTLSFYLLSVLSY